MKLMVHSFRDYGCFRSYLRRTKARETKSRPSVERVLFCFAGFSPLPVDSYLYPTVLAV